MLSGRTVARLAAFVAVTTLLCGVSSVNAQVATDTGGVTARFDSWDASVLQKTDRFKVGTTTLNGASVDEIVVPGRPPVGLKASISHTTQVGSGEGVVLLPNVPAFDWCYGCSPTSAAMAMGYYDNNGFPGMYTGPTNGGVCPLTNADWGSGESPLSATHTGYDGLAARGHVDDYWNDNCDPDPWIGNWSEHTHADCTADFMGTSQSSLGNCDGSTTFFYYTDGSPMYDTTGCEPTGRDGCHGMRLFVESRGYTVVTNYNQYIQGHNGNALGFTYDQYKAEIDAGRPVLIQVAGHTMLGYGYNTEGCLVYLRDTWTQDQSPREMTWGGSYSNLEHYAVTVLQLLGGGGYGDSYEPDDSSGQATTIVPGVNQIHSISPADDQDWAVFTLDRESEAVIETSGASGDTRMWLYDSALNEIEFDDDSGTGSFSLIERMSGVDPLPAGTYYVKIDENGNDDEIRAYTLSVTLNPQCSADVPKNIEDGAATESRLSIGHSVYINNIDVRLNIEHTYDADMEVVLEHPDGTEVVLFKGVGGDGDNFTDTVLDDSAATPISSGSAPFTGSYSPQNPLSAFNGKDSAGTWKLRVSDTFVGDTGKLLSWCLTIAGTDCAWPTITQQPWTVIRCDGESAAFTVAATGPEPLRYQWRLDGNDIDGATSPTYEIGSVTAADSGGYDCVVGNDCGSATSNTAYLEAGPCSTVSEAKAMPDGETVVMRNQVATTGFGDQWRIYLEQPDRASGIMFNAWGDYDWSGALFDLAGSLATNDNGERYIAIRQVQVVGFGDSILPVGMPNKLVGGGDWRYDPDSKAGQRGVVDGYGLNNIGLLVRTWGIVQSVDSDSHSYVISDGSAVALTVKPQGTESLPAVLDQVTVTGISSCANVDGQLQRLLLAVPETSSEAESTQR